MDQVKVALAILKKHHFWVLIVIVVLVGGGVWAAASSNLAKQFDTRKTDLEGKRKAVADLASQSSPPNQKFVDAILRQHDLLKENVLQTWEFLFKEQKEKNRWPQELGEEFLMVIESLGPEDRIPARYRETYQNFISNHLKTLDDIIDRRKPKYDPTAMNAAGMNAPGGMMPAEAMMTGGMPGEGTGRDAEWVGKVYWDDAERVKQLFLWNTRPETIQVRTAQEDLWVYEALLRIIKNTNSGATHYYNAAIKTVRELQIGRAAAMAFQQSAKRLKVGGLGAAGGAGGMMDGMGMEGMGMEGMGAEAGMGMGMDPMMGGGGEGMLGGGADLPPEERLRKQLYDGRYVDQAGKPLMADDPPPFAEFKMMPVRMLVIIDQRKIPKLLVECANSSMPVEVHRVTLSPGRHATINLASFGGSGGMGMDSGMGMGMGMEGGMNMGMDSGMGMPPGMGMDSGYAQPGMEMGGPGMDPGMGGAGGPRTYGQYDIPIEVEGVIYIFNPPDRTKLGTGSAGEESASQLSTPASAGAPSSPPPAPAGPVPAITVTPPPEPAPSPAGAAPAPATPPAATPAPAPGTAPTAPATPPEAAAPTPTPPAGAAPPAAAPVTPAPPANG